MLIDLHAKSSASDGVTLSAETVIKRARDRGLDAVAFAESSRTSHALELVELGKKYAIQVFVGIEISTDRGILLCFPPTIDTFLLEEEWRQANELTTPAADYVIEMINEVGGAVIASRPYDLEIPHNMGDWIFRIDGINAVEVFNPKVGRIQSDFAQEAAQSLTLPTTAGSDPCNSLDDIGKYATYFQEKILSQRDLVHALKHSTCLSILIGDVSQERSSRTPTPSQTPTTNHHNHNHNSPYDRQRRGGRPNNYNNRNRNSRSNSRNRPQHQQRRRQHHPRTEP